MSFTEKVYFACKCIPKGKVATYSQLARASTNFRKKFVRIGNSVRISNTINKPKSARAISRANACRAVGNALNKNRSRSVPCHRVIRSDGTVGGFARGTRAKIRMLRSEGVEIKNGKIPPRFLCRI
ncbi:MGMT family protein [Candidatus Micrarchaeota archaeon]|nr:MGMT family protein [Candidatus Micrarchaeota archaeon]